MRQHTATAVTNMPLASPRGHQGWGMPKFQTWVIFINILAIPGQLLPMHEALLRLENLSYIISWPSGKAVWSLCQFHCRSSIMTAVNSRKLQKCHCVNLVQTQANMKEKQDNYNSHFGMTFTFFYLKNTYWLYKLSGSEECDPNI